MVISTDIHIWIYIILMESNAFFVFISNKYSKERAHVRRKSYRSLPNPKMEKSSIHMMLQNFCIISLSL